jgi:glycosyltransferase involved in cell wall biosynthesis
MTAEAAPLRGDAGEKPIRVAFDHRIFLYQKHGGVSRYLVRLAEHLGGFGVHARIFPSLHVNEHLRDLPRMQVWGIQVKQSYNQERFGRRLGEALFGPLARLDRAQIVHETYFSPVAIAPPGRPVVLTIYDMIYERYPGFKDAEQLIENKRAAIARADRIVCISESTRRDLLAFYPEVEDRTSVTLLGFDPDFSTDQSPEAPHGRPYILYVGMRWRGYKNFAALIEAFGGSPALRRDFDLICIGGGDFSDEERGLMERAGVADRVLRREAGDSELRRWYRHAQLFAYPSLYEGFGIPPLEAMAADCPVVCVSAAEYAEPGDTASLRDALERVALSSGRADELRKAGRERIQRFSWRECARQTALVYRNAL